MEKNMKNQIAHITRRISVVAGLVAAFTLAPALSSIQSADASPRDKWERRHDKRERKFERRQEKRENRWERRNRWRNNNWNNNRWSNRNNSWNNRRYTTKYKTIWRNGKPYRQYYRVYY